MIANLFSRILAITARGVLLLALLLWPVGASNFAAADDLSNPLPPDLSAGDWRAVTRVLLADTWEQRAHINGVDAVNSQAFGAAVALDGDTLVVGAYADSHDGISLAGSVYVFEKPSVGWSAVTQAAKLTASDAAMRDYFGKAVAISGATIVAGAPADDSTGISNHGSVYVFVRPGSHWTDMTETAKLTASDKQSGDDLGGSVAISMNTIAAGARFNDLDGKTDQGSVYVFQRPPGGWELTGQVEDAQLTTSDGAAYDYFGSALAISGSTVIASAYAHSDAPGVVGVGKVYVYNQSGAWSSDTESAQFTASDGAGHEYFGWSVAMDGDLAVIGAPGEATFDDNGEESAYVFHRPISGWLGSYTETARLATSDGAIGDDFGHAVAVSGGVVVVGANTDSSASQDDHGSAYVFVEPPGGWTDMTQTQKLLAGDASGGDEFGTSVCVSGTAIVAGAPEDNIHVVGDHQGSAYIFDSAAESWLYTFLPLLRR